VSTPAAELSAWSSQTGRPSIPRRWQLPFESGRTPAFGGELFQAFLSALEHAFIPVDRGSRELERQLMELVLELAEAQQRGATVEELIADVQPVATYMFTATVNRVSTHIPEPFIEEWLLGEPD